MIRRRSSILVLFAIALAMAACSPAATAPGASVRSSDAAPGGHPSVDPNIDGPNAIDGIKCDLGGHDDSYHIHVAMGLVADDAIVPPPANIGIRDDCMFWVHTHDDDGIIHIEAPADVEVNLGNFMDIWASTDPADPLQAAFLAGLEKPGNVTVNDVVVTGEWDAITFHDGDVILIGTPPRAPDVSPVP